MGKKYEHKPPYKSEQRQLLAANTKLINQLQAATQELETLQTALRLLTSADKQDLLDAVRYVKDARESINWWVGNAGLTILGGTVSPGTTISASTYKGTTASTVIIDDVK